MMIVNIKYLEIKGCRLQYERILNFQNVKSVYSFNGWTTIDMRNDYKRLRSDKILEMKIYESL